MTLDLGKITAQIDPQLTPEMWDALVDSAVDRILANPAALRRLSAGIARENHRARRLRG